MATTTLENRPLLAPAVQAVLDGLKVRIRWYVWLHGATVALAWLGLAFWISLAIDYAFEPAQAVRLAILAAVASAALGVLVHLIFLRAFVPMSNSNMAMVLERRFSKFDDSLLTAVVLTGRDLDPAKCNPSMLARTCREAAETTAAEDRLHRRSDAHVFDIAENRRHGNAQYPIPVHATTAGVVAGRVRGRSRVGVSRVDRARIDVRDVARCSDDRGGAARFTLTNAANCA